jgi:uncharacterized protein
MSNVSSDKRWPWPLTALLAVVVLFFAGQFLVGMVVAAIMAASGRNDLENMTLFGSTVLPQFAYMLGAYSLMLGGLVWFLRSRRIGWRDLGLTRARPVDFGLAAVAFIVYMAATVMLTAVVSQLVPALDIDQRQVTGFENAAGPALVLVFVALVIVAPITEEVMMRGFLFGSLRQRWPFWLSTGAVSVLFAALHLGGGEEGAGPLWIAAIDTFMLSLVLCYLREKTGRLWASITLHMLKNGIAFAALFIFSAGN